MLLGKTSTDLVKETFFPLQMEFGVVYSCVEDKMYTGRKGKGAFCNGQKLQVSQQEGRFILQFLVQLIFCPPILQI
jgi:fructose-1,6-bisphosphatase/inositol monophosphatase family enzyme